MLGCRLGRRQSGQVLQNILLLGDPQRSLDRRKIMHRLGQGAVHVKHPVPPLGQTQRRTNRHFQSSRTRVRPSWATEATSWPARL